MAQILVIDDDNMLNDMLMDMLTRKHHSVTSAYTISDGLAKAKAGEFDVVFLDVQLPDGNGLDIIPQLKESISEPEIIIMTGRGDVNGAEIAVQCGAWCYLEKSSIAKELVLPLTRVLQYRSEKTRTYSPKILSRYEIVGSSQLINKSLKLVGDASCSDINVLITGETGTGKEVFANAIHQNSNRGIHGNFVVVDCSSLPESLVESILFGHVKGAYTGADIPRKGLVHQANGGTLFLDEIGELSPSIQTSFLRVLQERRFRPVGGSAEEVSDFRLIAATNRNLEEMADAGTFRKDLFYRVRSLEINLPPLHARGKDIIELAEYFFNLLCQRYNKEKKVFTSGFADALMAYSWPGNVRELYNALERVFTAAIDSPTYYTKNLPEEIQLEYIKSTLKNGRTVPADTNKKPQPQALASWKEYRNKNGHDYMLLLISHSRNNIQEACRLSGLSKARIYQLIKKYNIQTSFS